MLKGPPTQSLPRTERLPAHHLCALVLIGFLFLVFVSEVLQKPPATLDEPAWITAGFVTYELVRDLAPPSRWARAYDELGLGAWGNMNPPLGKLYVGLFVALAKQDRKPVRYMWSFPQDYLYNLRAGNIPPARLLMAARLGIAVSAGITLVLAYICAVLLVGRPWLPLIAPYALASFDTFQWHSTRVYMDIPQLAMLMASLAAFLAHLRSGRSGMFWLSTVLMGLACAVKFNSAPIILAAGAFVLLGSRRSFNRRVAKALVLAIVPFAVFVASNPYLYASPGPVHRSLEIVSSWSAVKEGQQKSPELEDQAVRSFSKGLALTATRSLLDPASAAWNQPVLRVPSPMLVFALALPLGVFHLFRRAIGGSQRSAVDGDLARYYLANFILFFLLTALWLPFDWSRYYLPVMVLVPPVYAAGLSEIADIVTRHGRKSVASPLS